MPLLVDEWTQLLHFSTTQIGLLASVDLIGIAASTATGPLWLHRAPWRVVLLSSLWAFLLLNFLCIGIHAFAALTCIRLCAGLAAGTSLTVGLRALTNTHNVARNSAFMMCAQAIYGALGLSIIPLLGNRWILDRIYVFLILTLLPAIMLSWKCFPMESDESTQKHNGTRPNLVRHAIFLVAGTFIFFLVTGAFWAYLLEIAQEAGLLLIQASNAMSMGMLFALGGSLGAAWLGLRAGRAIPISLVAIVQVLAYYAYTRIGETTHVVLAFYVINAVFQISWQFVISYFIVLFQDIDHSGKIVPLYGTAMHLGLCIGPFLGSLMIVHGNHAPILYFSIGGTIVCFSLFLLTIGNNTGNPTSVEQQAQSEYPVGQT